MEHTLCPLCYKKVPIGLANMATHYRYCEKYPQYQLDKLTVKTFKDMNEAMKKQDKLTKEAQRKHMDVLNRFQKKLNKIYQEKK